MNERNVMNQLFNDIIALMSQSYVSALSVCSCSSSQNRTSTVPKPFENRTSTVTIYGQLRLVTPLNAYERHPAIFSSVRARSATPTATNGNGLHLIAIGCGYLHPVAANTIFSAEPQQLQLIALSPTRAPTKHLEDKDRQRTTDG